MSPAEVLGPLSQRGSTMLPPLSRSASLSLAKSAALAVIAILFLLPGCAPTLPLYLEVWDPGPPPAQGDRAADLLLQPFTCAWGEEKANIGELLSWQSSQKIRIDKTALSQGITNKIAEQTTRQGFRPERTSIWNGTLEGLKKIDPRYKAVIGGSIRQLSIYSEKNALTVSKLSLVVDCQIGLPGAAVLVNKQIEVHQERTHMLQNASVFEELLNDGLNEAAVRLTGELRKVIASN
jgi:hypothetical protein